MNILFVTGDRLYHDKKTIMRLLDDIVKDYYFSVDLVITLGTPGVGFIAEQWAMHSNYPIKRNRHKPLPLKDNTGLYIYITKELLQVSYI
jgi:hypothetical protein